MQGHDRAISSLAQAKMQLKKNLADGKPSTRFLQEVEFTRRTW